MKIKIGLVDDHQLFSKSLGLMLASFNDFQVVVDASNGKELQEKMETLSTLPHILLIDVNMPIMNGERTARWVKKNYPSIRMAALSMNDNDHAIIEMFKAGCCAYFVKDINPTELESALKEIHQKGYYNSDHAHTKQSQLLMSIQEVDPSQVTEREIQFLVHACSDKTYQQVADAMGLSLRTIDGYRESMFAKLNVQSRTGMALEAIRRGLVKI